MTEQSDIVPTLATVSRSQAWLLRRATTRLCYTMQPDKFPIGSTQHGPVTSTGEGIDCLLNAYVVVAVLPYQGTPMGMQYEVLGLRVQDAPGHPAETLRIPHECAPVWQVEGWAVVNEYGTSRLIDSWFSEQTPANDRARSVDGYRPFTKGGRCRVVTGTVVISADAKWLAFGDIAAHRPRGAKEDGE